MNAADPSCPTIDHDKVKNDIDYVLKYIGETECTIGEGGSKYKRRGGGCSRLGKFLRNIKSSYNKVTPNARVNTGLNVGDNKEMTDNTYQLLHALAASNVPGLLASLCNLNTAAETIIAPLMPKLSPGNVKRLHERKILNFIPQIMDLITKYKKLDPLVTFGDIAIHSNFIYFYYGRIDRKPFEEMLKHYNSEQSSTGEESITFPGYDSIGIAERTVQYSEIFKKLDESLNSQLVIDVEYPDLEDYQGCFPRYKYNRDTEIIKNYHETFETRVEELNNAIIEKRRVENENAILRFQVLNPLRKSPEQLSEQRQEPQVGSTPVNSYLTKRGDDRRPVILEKFLTGDQIALVIRTLKNNGIKDLEKINNVITSLHYAISSSGETVESHLQKYIDNKDYFTSIEENFKRKNPERQVGFHTPGGGSIKYHKTTERFMYKSKHRIVWKKSTRKNSASFIKVKGKYINIKTI